MGTLYELLGALPDDDAEALRVAFRRAAKATHPDTNPDDPDAALRFRQLVRAHDILSDADQRAAYDQLLAVATRPPLPPAPPPRAAVYEKIHRGATNTMAATIIAAVLIGGYTVFSHISQTEAMPDNTARIAESSPLDVTSALPQGAAARDVTAEKRESAAAVNEPTTTDAVAAAANAVNPPLAVITLPAPAPVPADARTLHQRGMSAYRSGDLGAALAHFNLAIAQDPGFAAAYIDRGIVFYRMRKFDRAFADMSHAKRLAKTGKDKARSVAQTREKPRAPVVVSHPSVPRWRVTAAVTP
jgi:tetratricopeptide (TPR) repeat protein